MKLFVDDIRNAPDDSWSLARSVGTAISFISRFKDEIEEVSLDHDISHQVEMGAVGRPYPCVETFTSVAQYIAAVYTIETQPELTIHTANPSGAQIIAGVLDDHGLTYKIEMAQPVNRLEMEVK